MKYIRTKDGTIKTQYDTIRPQFVEKRADTIEELCDVFDVVADNIETSKYNPTHSITVSIHKAKKLRKLFQETTNVKVFGAIWTDEGLIYVAKMNKKGELELL